MTPDFPIVLNCTCVVPSVPLFFYFLQNLILTTLWSSLDMDTPTVVRKRWEWESGCWGVSASASSSPLALEQESEIRISSCFDASAPRTGPHSVCGAVGSQWDCRLPRGGEIRETCERRTRTQPRTRRQPHTWEPRPWETG